MTAHLIRWLFALGAVLVLVAPAAAEDKIKQAAAHYRQGKAYEQAGQLDQAIGEYKAAHALDGKASHLFNIARAFDAKGDPKAAIEFYDKFLAVEAEGANAKSARELKAIAVKKVTEEAERKKADEEARKKADTKIAAENHAKQAALFAQSNQWANAAEEYKRATDVDGDPEHLFDAAEAYRKVPDLAKARATFEQYRDKVKVGGRSDLARTRITEIADEMAKGQQVERRVGTVVTRPPIGHVDLFPKKSRFSPKLLAIGAGLLLGGLVADLVPEAGKNGKLDATDFIAPVMYGVGAALVIAGVF